MATGIIERQSGYLLCRFGISNHTFFLGICSMDYLSGKTSKRGGIIALVVMFASLILSIWVIIEHLNHVGPPACLPGQPHGGMVRPGHGN